MWSRSFTPDRISSVAMAKNLDQEPSSVSECPVCWNAYDNLFRTPKLLRCGHSFCIECLAHLSLIAATQNQLPCPLCRCLTLLPANQQVTELPTNVPLLHKLGLEPNHIILEGRQLCLKEQRKARYFLRQPRVYTLDLGVDPELGTQPYPESPQPATVASTPTVPRRSLLRECTRNPHLRIFTYLMVIILSVTLLLVFSVFWTKNFSQVWDEGEADLGEVDFDRRLVVVGFPQGLGTEKTGDVFWEGEGYNPFAEELSV